MGHKGIKKYIQKTGMAFFNILKKQQGNFKISVKETNF